MKPKAKQAPKNFDDYLAGLGDEQRIALEKIRRAIHVAAPGLEECVSYGLPAFQLRGQFLMALGAAKHHCSFHTGSTLQRHKDALAGFETSKGTIRFRPDHPRSDALVKRLVKARIAEKSRVGEKEA